MYKFIIEENVREIRRVEIIAASAEDAFEEYLEGNYKIIWRKMIDNEGIHIIRQVELEDNQ